MLLVLQLSWYFILVVVLSSTGNSWILGLLSLWVGELVVCFHWFGLFLNQNASLKATWEHSLHVLVRCVWGGSEKINTEKRVLRKILSRQCSSLLVKDRLQFILRLDASSYLFPSSSSRYTKCTWLQELFSSNPPSASCSWVISRSEWCQIMFPTWSNVFRMHLWPHRAHFLGRVLLQMFLYLGTITVFSLPRQIIPWG